jgi:uncharacterized protein
MKKIFKSLLKVILVVFVLLNVIVIFHAYKFTHHYEPNEVVIKTDAEKTGWDKTKEILFGFKMPKQKNIAPDSAYRTVKITTNDNLKLDAWFTAVDSSKGTVAMFHGHAGKKSGILKEAESFRELGYNTLLVDLRAHGNSEGNTCTIGFDEGADIKAAYDYLQQKGEKNIVLYGISLGAASITKGINDFALTPSKVILEMPFGSLPEAVIGRVKMMGLPAQPISTLLTFWGGTMHGFWAFGMKPNEYAKKIKCPVLLQWGKTDPRVTQKEMNDIFTNVSTAKKLVVYENSGHQSLCTNEHEKWMSNVSVFLQ